MRGKLINNGEWVEGNLFIPDRKDTPTQMCIGTNIIRITYDIIPDTIGQYTGLIDENGKKIFEGDIVRAQDDVFGSPFYNGIVGMVTFEETAFFVETMNIIDTQYLFNECAVYEVIGNIHDNPELLKGGEE